MDFARQQRDPTRHVIGITFVILMHVLLIWALISGLGRKVVEVIKKPLTATIIEEIKAPPPPPLVKPEVLKIDIDSTGAIYWNGEVISDRAALEEKFKVASAQPVQPELHLRPDKGAKYEVVAAVMVSAQRLGMTKIGIVGSEQFIE